MTNSKESMKSDLYKEGFNAAVNSIQEMTNANGLFATPATLQELHQKIDDFSNNGYMTVQFTLNFLSQEINKMKEV